MRWRILIAAGVGVAALLAFAAMPLLALRELRSALEARAPAAVAPLVDFPALHANVKAETDRKIERANDDSFLEPLRDWIGKGLAAEALDRIATPAGLIRLSCDQQTDADLSKAQGKPCVLNGKVEHLAYLSLNRFRIDVRPQNGKPFAMILARHGLFDWRLVDITAAGRSG